jgi:hypothetical protein
MAKVNAIESTDGNHCVGNVAGFYDVSINLHLDENVECRM